MQFNRFHRRAIAIAVALGTFAGAALAVDPFTVRDIRVEGLQRVEAGTIFASLPVRVGDIYDDEKGAAAIQSIFALGLFKDVRIEVSGDVLVVIVEERPTIADVEFVGNKEFDKDVLRRMMRDIGLADGRPFDKALLDRAEQEIKRQYINRSLYASEVVTTVTPIERNRVNLAFTITEGERAKIKEIRIVGNKAFSESTLRNLFDLDTGGWLSWYTKSDQYSRAKLNADIESLRSYYLTRGYLEFRVDSTQVVISPDKQEIGIAINVTEGERYVVSGVKLEGNYLGKDDEFKSLVAIRPGRGLQRRRSGPDHQGVHRLFRQLRLRLCAGRGAPGSRSGQQPGRVADPGRAVAPGLCPSHQCGGKQPHPRRSGAARVPPVRSRPGTTATRSGARATGSTAWGSSARCRSKPTRSPARQTRST